MLIGWDVRQASIGFLIDRANVLGIEAPLVRLLGRTPDKSSPNEVSASDCL